MLKLSKIGVLITLITCTSVAVAQQKKLKLISEGRISYDIALDGDINPMMAAMMPKEMVMYFKDNRVRSELNGMGWSSTTIADTKARNNITLIDMMGNKRSKKLSAEEVDKNYAEHKPTITILKETKDIAGFKCTKAEITDSKGEKSYVYFTKAIAARNGVNLNLRDIDGFLMEYQINQNGINLKVTARGINGAYKVDESLFMVPEGYQEMTKEDLQKMGGSK